MGGFGVGGGVTLGVVTVGGAAGAVVLAGGFFVALGRMVGFGATVAVIGVVPVGVVPVGGGGGGGEGDVVRHVGLLIVS